MERRQETSVGVNLCVLPVDWYIRAVLVIPIESPIESIGDRGSPEPLAQSEAKGLRSSSEEILCCSYNRIQHCR